MASNLLLMEPLAPEILARFDGTADMPIDIQELRKKTIWIRDVLEPYVAQQGPRYLSPDCVLEVNAFLASFRILIPRITLDHLKISRVHRAFICISGRGTRWPKGLVEICDVVIEELSARFGRLDHIRPLLYQKGGRLAEFADEQDIGRHGLIMKWLADPSSRVTPLNAHESGHLGFKPGQWWIHPVFAFHSGIIDSPDPDGGISADEDGVYAILATTHDEVDCHSADNFVYRCRQGDRGRFRLIGGILPPKASVRVLRSHTLRGPNAPKAGIRYEGLYKVMGYAFHTVNGEVVYDIRLNREMDQISMREVLTRPTSEEVDDYIEYKRIREKRQVHFQDDDHQEKPLAPSPQLVVHDHLDAAKPMHSPSYIHPVKAIPPPTSPGPSPLRHASLTSFPVSPSGLRTMASLTSILAHTRSQETDFDTPGAEDPEPSLSYMKQSRAYDGTHDHVFEFEKVAELRKDDDTHSTVSSVSPKTKPRHIRKADHGDTHDEKDSALGSVSTASLSPQHRFAYMPLRTDQEAKKDSGISMLSDEHGRHSPEPSRLVAKVLEQASIETLSSHLDELNLVTLRRGSMGASFCEDMMHIQHTLEEVRTSAEGTTRKESLDFLETVEHDIETVREKVVVRRAELEEDSASPLGDQCLQWEKRYSLGRHD